MINEYNIYKMSNQYDLEINSAIDLSFFLPEALTEGSMHTLLDSLCCWELYVEYEYRYIGYDADDDVLEKSHKVMPIEEAINHLFAIGCIYSNAAIVIDDKEHFLGVLLESGSNDYFISPFSSTHRTITLRNEERIYPHGEEKTVATFMIRQKSN